MTEEPRNIPATKGNAKATLTKSQVATWKADGWTVEDVKAKSKAATRSELSKSEAKD